MSDDLDEAGLDELVRALDLDQHLESIKWQEFHFFNPSNGLSKTDLTSIRICLDYEQARESKDVVSFIASLDEKPRYKEMSARDRLIDIALKTHNRYVPVDWHGEETSIATAPTIPAVCLAASWFPAPWLSAGWEARRTVTNRIRQIYNPRALPCWSFPMESEQAELLTAVAQQENQTLHVIAVDHARPFTALIAAFSELLKEIGVSGNMWRGRRGKVKLASALEDLGCYRLSRISAAARSDAMVAVGFTRSANKISDGKRRAIRRLRSLGHI